MNTRKSRLATLLIGAILLAPTASRAVTIWATINDGGVEGDIAELEYDLVNGQISLTRSLDVDGFEPEGGGQHGLAYNPLNDTLFLFDGSAGGGSDLIFEIDRAGNVLTSFSVPTTGLQGLAFIDGTLWGSDATGSVPDRIVQIDTVNQTLGTAIDVAANLGGGFDGAFGRLFTKLASPDNRIVEIDASDGALGPELARSAQAGGLAYDGTFLFWNQFRPDGNTYLDWLNPDDTGETGMAVLPFRSTDGLAVFVPEPGSLPLLALGLAGIAVGRRRRILKEQDPSRSR